MGLLIEPAPIVLLVAIAAAAAFGRLMRTRAPFAAALAASISGVGAATFGGFGSGGFTLHGVGVYCGAGGWFLPCHGSIA